MRTLGQPTLRVDDEILLRPWVAADAPQVVTAFADPDIRYWHMRTIDDEDEALAWIDGWKQQWDDEAAGNWAIVRTGADGSEQVLGQGGLRSVDLFEGWGEITYWVVPAGRGTGVATRAAIVLAQWILEDLGLARLELMHSTANEASCHVADKAGFLAEGTLRHAVLHADGWHDMHLHSRVATDLDRG
jgi:ribosomal-protein-alanine N-acetyltransferase